jgi:hypothetical protein
VATLILFFVPKDDWRGVVQYINQEAESGDLVWMDPVWNRFPYDYYQAEINVSLGNVEAVGAQLAAAETVWFIAERYGQGTRRESEIWLQENMELHHTVPFYRLELQAYRPFHANAP